MAEEVKEAEKSPVVESPPPAAAPVKEAVDEAPRRRLHELAREIGASHTFDPTEVDVWAELARLHGTAPFMFGPTPATDAFIGVVPASGPALDDGAGRQQAGEVVIADHPVRPRAQERADRAAFGQVGENRVRGRCLARKRRRFSPGC